MKNRDADLDEFARARLAYLTAGRPPLVGGPRRGAQPGHREDQAPQPPAGHHPDEGQPPGLLDELLDAGSVDLERPSPSERTATHPSTLSSASVPSRLDLRLAGLPEPMARAVGFARGHLVAVAAVLVLGVVLTAAFLMRSRATSIPLESVARTPMGTSTGSPAPTAASAAAPTTPAAHASPVAARIEVHVLGAVARPGVVTLAQGARVQDALTAAGGLRRGAAPGELNLAAPVTDGDQLLIGTVGHPRGEVRHAGEAAAPPVGAGTAGSAIPTAGGTGGGTAVAASGVVDLNSATVEQLDSLPGVGPVTAQRILAWRAAHQRFSRIEELQEVDGIGPKTYAQLSSHVRV